MTKTCSPSPRAALKKARARVNATHGAAAESEMEAIESEAAHEARKKKKPA